MTNAGISWNVVSYVRQQTAHFLDIHVKDFTDDAATRGYLQRAWYLTSVQFGFEPWVGGTGLGVDDFSFTARTAGTMVGRGSNRCLDVQGAGTVDGTPVQISDCNGNQAQQWTAAAKGALVNPLSAKCLDVSGAGTANGTPVQIYDCNGTGAQQWTLNSDGTVVNPNSGKCLDVSGQATADGSRLQIWDCNPNHDQLNQLWTRY
jgi:endoglucanase